MARLHTKKKGKSGSRKVTGIPKWLELSAEDAGKLIVELRKDGHTTAEIGTILRDQYGIASVRNLCKKSVVQVITEKIGKINYPDDLLALIKRAVSMKKHLVQHKYDVSNRLKLQNVESKIRRIGRYYVRKKMLPEGWLYTPEQAALLVR